MGILGKGLTCSAFFILTAFSLSAEAKTCGTFNHVEGDVKYLSKSGETQWQEASLGESICPGGSIASSSCPFTKNAT